MATALSMLRQWESVKNPSEYKGHVEEAITGLKAEAAALSGREHHKERSTKGKIIAELCACHRYIDACRVSKGLAPAHGFFASEAGDVGDSGSVAKDTVSGLSREEAARIAGEVEAALAELAPQPHQEQCPPLDHEGRVRRWRQRLAKLEAKLTNPIEQPPKGNADIDELEGVAQEIVNYRQELKTSFGYREKDFKDDADLQQLEERLDILAGAFLPVERPPPDDEDLDVEADELRQWERRLEARVAAGRGHHAQAMAHLGPTKAREVEQLVAEVAELKGCLRAQGYTEHEQDKDERVLMRLVRLAELQKRQSHDKKYEKREKHELETIRDEFQALVRKLEAHKRRLQDERGFSHKEVKHDPEVRELEERLATLQKALGH
mmetsp:Transcript_31487/g.86645  ORF Transcript_31487/g.86645 Transcript_31487/m.86645 type:complete len:380 (+) Transcript_31487:53-1192(+)